MALNTLTLTVAIGYSGFSFRSGVLGLTAGSEVVLLPVSGEGVGYANGFVHSESMPTDDAVFQLVEYLPSTGERKTTQLRVATAEYFDDARAALAANPGASLSPAGITFGDGSYSWGTAARVGSGGPILSGGASGPSLVFSPVLSPVPEDTAAGTLIGILSVANPLAGTYVFTEETDASGKFSNNGTNGRDVRTAGTWDYETATSYSVRYKADNGAGSVVYLNLTVPVSDVVEPTDTYFMGLTHGDSRLVSIVAATGADVDYARVEQYLSATSNFTSDITPLEQAISYDGTDYISMATRVAMRLVDLDPHYHADISGGGWNGQSIAYGSHTLGALPDTTTQANVNKGGAMYTKRGVVTPGATRVPYILSIAGANDAKSDVTPTAMLAGTLAMIPSLRTATGFGSAPVIIVGVTPEEQAAYGTALIETALKVAALKTAGCYYCPIPPGNTTDALHEGPTATVVRNVGDTVIARVVKVALGLQAGITPNLTVSSSTNVDQDSNTEINLGIDQPAYWTIDPATSDGTGALNPSAFVLSGDVAQTTQTLKPAAGTWATLGTFRVRANYLTGDRIAGSATLAVVVNAVVAPTTWLVYDPFTAADGNLAGRTAPGDGSTGGGATWAVPDADGYGRAAFIESNKAGLGGIYPQALIETGAGNISVSADVTISTGNKGVLIAGWTDATNRYSVQMGTDGQCRLVHPFGLRVFGDISGLSTGTYNFEIRLDRANDLCTFLVDGVVQLGPVGTTLGDDLAYLGTKAGFGNEAFAASGHRFDNFKVKAYP